MKNKLWSIALVLVMLLASALPAHAAAQLNNVTDEAAILTDGEWEELEQQARDISERYDVGIYIVTLDNYRNYTNGDIYDAADEIYHGYTLGMGEERNGLMLLLSMEDRDYLLIAYGSDAKYAFNDDGREALAEFFLDDFADDAWYDGFADYLMWSEDYLAAAEGGEPYSGADVQQGVDLGSIALILFVPLLIAGVYILILISKMKSVAKAAEASEYVAGALNLTRNSDYYTHTTKTRRKIEKKTSSGGSSGRSSGGGSGTRGKF